MKGRASLLLSFPILASLALLSPASSFGQPVAPAMPAGHPTPSGAPTEPEQDRVEPAPELPPGSIEVRLVDSQGNPVPSSELRLGILFQKIAEGEQRTEKQGRTDQNGIARFTGLTPSSEFSYRVTTRSGPAEYASDPIVLKPEMGVRVLLHVYPVTRDVKQARVGSRGFVYIETRDDVFQFEVLFRYFNMGGVTWVPEAARMSLPTGFKAFKAGETMTDVRFELLPEVGVSLQGTFSPGQHNVSFRFQLPRSEVESSSFRFGLPPHIQEMRVIAAAAPSMQLDVDGFEKPVSDVNQNGQRVLVTRRLAKRGEPELQSFGVVLSGIPTPGPGRWVAALIAAALALVGFSVFRGKLGTKVQSELHERDASRARQVLLDELVDLTRAHREGRIGPSTYESARRVLVEALARILSSSPELAKKAKKAPPVGGQKKPKKRGGSAPVRPSGPASTA